MRKNQAVLARPCRVLESEAVESLALSGGFLALVAGTEVIVAGAILGATAGGW